MYTKIQKWGNSYAVRLPKSLLESVKMKENSEVEIKVQDGNLIIIPIKKHKTLEGRIAEYQGEHKCEEWNAGKPKGNEVL